MWHNVESFTLKNILLKFLFKFSRQPKQVHTSILRSIEVLFDKIK